MNDFIPKLRTQKDQKKKTTKFKIFKRLNSEAETPTSYRRKTKKAKIPEDKNLYRITHKTFPFQFYNFILFSFLPFEENPKKKKLI